MQLLTMRLFKKKSKPPLEEAIGLVYQAVEIAYKYKRDKRYQPTEADLASFARLEQVLWRHHATAQYIASAMHQRFKGEAEGAKKFSDPELFDYHYPD